MLGFPKNNEESDKNKLTPSSSAGFNCHLNFWLLALRRNLCTDDCSWLIGLLPVSHQKMLQVR